MTADRRSDQLLETAFLTFANIETAIAAHLDTRCLLIDPATRLLLARLRDSSGSVATRLRRAIAD